ncbi:hypothetical protein ACFDTO_32705 [Microbacteriaceae bacterium 4G12]
MNINWRKVLITIGPACFGFGAMLFGRKLGLTQDDRLLSYIFLTVGLVSCIIARFIPKSKVRDK